MRGALESVVEQGSPDAHYGSALGYRLMPVFAHAHRKLIEYGGLFPVEPKPHFVAQTRQIGEACASPLRIALRRHRHKPAHA